MRLGFISSCLNASPIGQVKYGTNLIRTATDMKTSQEHDNTAGILGAANTDSNLGIVRSAQSASLFDYGYRSLREAAERMKQDRKLAQDMNTLANAA